MYTGLLNAVENSRNCRTHIIQDLIRSIRELPVGPNYEKDREALVNEIRSQQELFNRDNKIFDELLRTPVCKL